MKIGIVNDLSLAIESMRQALSQTPEHQISWIAYNGAEAVEHCTQNKPDLILMDLMMPVMDGVEATKRIMRTTPCPILVVTSTVEGHSSKIFEAMGAGALDVVATPIFSRGGETSGADVLLKKINNIGLLTGNQPTPRARPKSSRPAPKPQTRKETMVAIGCSTGGPNVLVQIFSALPVDFPASIVVVQHMDEQFTPGLVDWLNTQTDLPVRIISEGDAPQAGVIQFACTDDHMVLTPQNKFRYTKEPKENFYHPSVDVFFDSIAKNWKGSIIGILLTGMGRDGAEGLFHLNKQGFHTIAQDQATSIVYGMPKAAAQLGAATDILATGEIPKALMNILLPARGKKNV